MKKKKSFLGLYLIISFVFIIAAVVVSLTAGINLGSDIGGGTQFEVTIDGNKVSKQQINSVKEVLSDNGVKAEKVFAEDKYVDTLIVVRIADKTVQNQNQIRTSIAEKLNIDLSDVSEFKVFNSTITNKVILWTGITIACLLLLVFIVGWIRYQLVAGLSLTFSLLHTILLAISLFTITRNPITKISLIEILVSVILVMLAMVFVLERIKENAALKHNESLSTIELVEQSKKQTLKPLIYLASSILLVCIVFICVPVYSITLAACGLITSLAVAIYSYYLVSVNFHERMLDVKVRADKIKLSKNSSPAPSKDKTKKEKINKI